jgi:hypothetical protein
VSAHLRHRFLIGAACCLAVVAAIVAPAPAHAEGVTVYRTGGCGFLLYNAGGTLHGDKTFFDANAQVRQTVTPAGTSVMTCNGVLPADVPAPDRAVAQVAPDGVLDRVFCVTQAGVAREFRQVTMPGGTVVLTCKL